MKERVWLAVQRARRLQQSARSSAPLWIRRKPAFLAGLLLLSAATAGAVIGRRVVDQQHTTAAASLPKTGAVDNHHVARRSSQVALAPAPTVNGDQPPSMPRVEVRGPVSRPAMARMTMPRAKVSRRAPISSVAERSAQGGNQILVDAMVALRRDRDSQRAGELLERFLSEFPRGALREEALALSVEAALARNDTAGRDRWARAYLQAYPAGRFREFVEGSLSAQ